MDIHVQGSALSIVLSVLQSPLSPEDAVRPLNSIWGAFGVNLLCEEFLQELEVLIRLRRQEFITALSEMMEQVERQVAVNTARAATLSQTSSVTYSEGSPTAASLTNSGGSPTAARLADSGEPSSSGHTTLEIVPSVDSLPSDGGASNASILQGSIATFTASGVVPTGTVTSAIFDEAENGPSTK
jgi:hypothetical protein